MEERIKGVWLNQIEDAYEIGCGKNLRSKYRDFLEPRGYVFDYDKGVFVNKNEEVKDK